MQGNPTEIQLSKWAEISPLLPDVLIDSVKRNPDRRLPWIEQIHGSLLMADISGFTPMTETLSEAGKEGAEWLTGIINQYFKRMLDIALDYGGSNIKFGGDALLIYFSGENHATRAVTVADAMQRATRGFKVFRAGKHRFRLRMTVGVHSADFWSVAAGREEHGAQYFVLGPETNLLCQVQATASAGELAISQQTKQLCGRFASEQERGIAVIVQKPGWHPRGQVVTVPSVPQRPVSIQPFIPYLPSPVIKDIRDNQPIKPAEGEHRKVTIVFINLLGINEMLQNDGSGAVLAEIHKYLVTLSGCCIDHGGFISSSDVYTHGLKIILTFGAPVAHEHDAANALRFVIALDSELRSSGFKLKHRIGINSGFVFAGEVGTAYRRQYTVMGDAVNLSARIMSACSPGGILLSRQVLTDAGSGFDTTELPPIKVKGKKAPVEVFELKGERRLENQSGEEPGGILLGREEQVDIFNDACGEVANGVKKTVLVDGEPGIGKSRLMREYIGHVAARSWTVYRGTCYSYSVSKPFTPWGTILTAFFGLDSKDDPGTRNDKVTKTIRRLRPDMVELAPLLNTFLGLSIQQNEVVKSYDQVTLRKRLFELVSSLLHSASRESVISLFIEDLHWADNSSLQLLAHVASDSDSGRLLMCASHRPKADLAIAISGNSLIRVVLGELPTPAAVQLVEMALGRVGIPEPLMKAILFKARGNPLFLEETAISLRRAGVVDKIVSGSALELTEAIAAVELPEKVQALIMSRFDGLGNQSKEIIRVASVIGSVFGRKALGGLLGPAVAGEGLGDRLEQLVGQDFIVRNYMTDEEIFQFKNNIIQEVVYNSILFARRRELHQKVGDFLEDSNHEKLEPVYEELVFHYHRSRDNDKTRVYALLAAEKSKRVFAHDEAINFYRRGFAAVDGKGTEAISKRSRFIELIGDCYEISGRHVDAAGNFLNSLRQWRRALRQGTLSPVMQMDSGAQFFTKPREAELGQKIGVSYERTSEYDLSLKWLAAAESSLPRGYPLQAARIQVAKSVAYFRKGQHAEAIKWGKIALKMAKRSGQTSELAYTHSMLASPYRSVGKLALALRHRLAAVQLFDELQDLSGQAVSNNNLGGTYQAMGKLDEALGHYRISLSACQRLGNATRVAIANNNIGEVMLMQGKLEDAAGYFRKVVDTYRLTGDPAAAAGLAMVNLSRVSQRQQHSLEAKEHLESAIEILRKAGAHALLTEARVQEAELALENGSTDTARQLCQRALRDAAQMGMRLLEARALRLHGRIDMLNQDGFAGADKDLRRSLVLANQLGADYDSALALVTLAELESKRNRGNTPGHRQVVLAERAYTIFTRLGIQTEAERAQSFQTAPSRESDLS